MRSYVEANKFMFVMPYREVLLQERKLQARAVAESLAHWNICSLSFAASTPVSDFIPEIGPMIGAANYLIPNLDSLASSESRLRFSSRVLAGFNEALQRTDYGNLLVIAGKDSVDQLMNSLNLLQKRSSGEVAIPEGTVAVLKGHVGTKAVREMNFEFAFRPRMKNSTGLMR
ncbi:MAG: hypothetical protein ACM3IJ_00475 [Candidatus Levyibacteriota bacterium]